MSAPTREDMLKKVTDPQTVENAVNRFFGELDKENKGVITVEGFHQMAEQLRQQFKSPEMKDEKRKLFDEVIAKNSTEGNMTRENLAVVLKAFFRGVEEYIKSLP